MGQGARRAALTVLWHELSALPLVHFAGSAVRDHLPLAPPAPGGITSVRRVPRARLRGLPMGLPLSSAGAAPLMYGQSQ